MNGGGDSGEVFYFGEFDNSEIFWWIWVIDDLRMLFDGFDLLLVDEFEWLIDWIEWGVLEVEFIVIV